MSKFNQKEQGKGEAPKPETPEAEDLALTPENEGSAAESEMAEAENVELASETEAPEAEGVEAPAPGYQAPDYQNYQAPPGQQQGATGYQAPPPGYQTPDYQNYQAQPGQYATPGYQAPPPGYQQAPPPPGYQQAPPPPGYQQAPPPPGYQQAPPPGYQQAPAYYQHNRPVGFLEAYKAYWKNYANFNDRTSRAGYWWVVLWNAIIGTVFGSIMGATVIGGIARTAIYDIGSGYGHGFGHGGGFGQMDPGMDMFGHMGPGMGMMAPFLGFGIAYVIYLIWGLANLVPSLAIGVRRLHDTGKSWVWILFGLIPVAGAIILIVFFATESKYPPENRFGYLRQV